MIFFKWYSMAGKVIRSYDVYRPEEIISLKAKVDQEEFLHSDLGCALENEHGRWNYFHGHLHCVTGPAIILNDKTDNPYIKYYIMNKNYETKEKWFEKLTTKEKHNYLWNLDE